MIENKAVSNLWKPPFVRKHKLYLFIGVYVYYCVYVYHSYNSRLCLVCLGFFEPN